MAWIRSSPPPSKTNTTSSRTSPDWSITATSHRLGSSSSSRGREFKACSYAYRIAPSQSRSHPKCLRALACTLGDMSPLAHSRANRFGTATNPLQGSTFHQRRQCLRVQTHRHSDARPHPHRRTPRARSQQLSQVIPTLGLISPRLNLLISHGDPTKKTLTHMNIVYEIHLPHHDFGATEDTSEAAPTTSLSPRARRGHHRRPRREGRLPSEPLGLDVNTFSQGAAKDATDSRGGCITCYALNSSSRRCLGVSQFIVLRGGR